MTTQKALLTVENMLINSDKPHRWKADVSASVDQYNKWFIDFAPLAYRETRQKTVVKVREDLDGALQLKNLTASVLLAHPHILPTLRMTTAPPLARDRLIGLAQVPPNLVKTMESGKIPPRMSKVDLLQALDRICAVIRPLIDQDLFPWLADPQDLNEAEQERAATVVADRLCGAVANPIIRNAQESRQLELLADFLIARGYHRISSDTSQPIVAMPPGTFSLRRNIVVGTEPRVNIPIDIMIQPFKARPNHLPILIEAKSAGDFTNTNKRRKEEATKIRQLRDAYGEETQLVLFLCGYFNTGYLGYEAAEGLDWVWEHRINDLLLLEIDP